MANAFRFILCDMAHVLILIPITGTSYDVHYSGGVLGWRCRSSSLGGVRRGENISTH